jgi:D-alanyl-D-alanine carboxypeptidase
MKNTCENSQLIQITLLLFKYIIPIILIIIGFIKLSLITTTKNAIKKFLKNTTIGIIISILAFITQNVINNNCRQYNKIKEEKIEKKTEEQTEINKQEKEQTSIKEENKIENIDGVTYIDGILIVNKTYSLPENYKAPNAGEYEFCLQCLTQETKNNFNEMQADAQSIGLNIYISSGYRSYKYQEKLYNNYVYQDGLEEADTYSARPGHSEHQTGLAFDLNTIDDSFALTEEGKWIKDNCYKYGFILRYPKGKEKETGYQYESWHLRYVGKDLAEKLYNNGNWITLEEHFNITSEYK